MVHDSGTLGRDETSPASTGARPRIGSRQDGEDPDRLTDSIAEIAQPGLHGGGGDPAGTLVRPADRSKE